MPRHNGIWQRKGRPFLYCKIRGKVMNLGREKRPALKKFHQLMAKDQPTPMGFTTEQVVSRFLDWCACNQAETTHAWYKTHLSQFSDFFGHTPAEHLDPEALRRWADGSRGKIRTCKRCFNWAVNGGLISASPWSRIQTPSQPTPERKLDKELFAKLLRNCS